MLNNSTQYWKGAFNSMENTFCGCSRAELPNEETFKEDNNNNIPIYVADNLITSEKSQPRILKVKESSFSKIFLI